MSMIHTKPNIDKQIDRQIGIQIDRQELASATEKDIVKIVKTKL